MPGRAVAPSLAIPGLLCEAAAVYHARFGLLLAATVVAQAPAALCAVLVGYATSSQLDSMLAAALPHMASLDEVLAVWLSLGAGRLLGYGLLTVFSALLNVVATVLSQAALAYLVVVEPRGPGALATTYRAVLARFGPLFGALLLAGFIVGAVLVVVLALLLFLTAVQYLLVPSGDAPPVAVQLGLWALLCAIVLAALAYALYAIVRWALFVQVATLEDTSPAAALRRSARLVRGHWWRTAGLLTVLAAGQSIASVLAAALLSAPLERLGGRNLGGVGGGLGFALASFVYFPLAANALTALYQRLRAREQTASLAPAASAGVPASAQRGS